MGARTTARSRRVAAGALALALVVATAACSGDDDDADDEAPEDAFTPSTLPFDPADEDAPTGSDDPGIPDEVPEPVTVSELPDLEAGHMLVASDQGGGLIGLNVVDPSDGTVLATIDTAINVFDVMSYGLVGGADELPEVVGVESWRPRGNRGEVEMTVSFYEGDMREVPEVALPVESRPHWQVDSASVSDDGRYLYLWDDLLRGVRVVDLVARTNGGEARVEGCGHNVLPVGADTLYALCWRSGEVVEVTVADGVPEEGERATLFPEELQVLRTVTFGRDADVAIVVTSLEEAFRLDLADGLPSDELEPTSIARDGLFPAELWPATVSPDGEQVLLQYVAGDRPDGDFAELVQADATTFEEVAVLDVETLDYEPVAWAWAADGSVFYGLGDTEADEPESVLVAYDPATGAEQSRVSLTLPDSSYGLWGLLSPTVVE